MDEFLSLESFIPSDLLQDTITDFMSKFPLFTEAEIVIMNYNENDEENKELVQKAREQILAENQAWIDAFNKGGADPNEEYPHIINFNNFCYNTKDDITIEL
jgi:precorrin-3B methylase